MFFSLLSRTPFSWLITCKNLPVFLCRRCLLSSSESVAELNYVSFYVLIIFHSHLQDNTVCDPRQLNPIKLQLCKYHWTRQVAKWATFTPTLCPVMLLFQVQNLWFFGDRSDLAEKEPGRSYYTIALYRKKCIGESPGRDMRWLRWGVTPEIGNGKKEGSSGTNSCSSPLPNSDNLLEYVLFL